MAGFLIDREEGEIALYNQEEEEKAFERAFEEGLNVHGTFLTEEYTHEERVRFLIKFKSLRPGELIPPGRFQEWLHPEFKNDHTHVPEKFSEGWIRMNTLSHYPTFPKEETST